MQRLYVVSGCMLQSVVVLMRRAHEGSETFLLLFENKTDHQA
jgi:hypothetical protein